MKSPVIQRFLAGLCLSTIACAAAFAQQRDDRVIRVVLSAERLAGFAEHTKDHLGLLDTRDAAIPLEEFVSPGSRLDPLPALTDPKRVGAADAEFPPDDGIVVEVVVDGEAVAYPLSLLTYHGVINDTIGDTPVAVWFDPISYGLAVFRRDPVPVRGDANQVAEFRLAGLLVRGGAALYEANSRSLISPLDGIGVSGAYAGVALEYLPFRVTSMRDFAQVRRSGEVIAKPTGTPFDYGVNPFAEYQGDRNLVYIKVTDDLRLPPKTPGVGVSSGEEAYFIPLGAMANESRRVMTERGPFEASLTPDRTLYVREAPPGATIAQAYYANWVAAHPTTRITLAVDLRNLNKNDGR